MAGAGHVPKYGGQNGGFTEVFALARTGGKGGSGNGSQEDPPQRASRGAPTAVPPRRVSGSGSGGSGSGHQERESGGRSSQEGGMLGSNRPSPPARPEGGRGGRGGRGGNQDAARGGRKPRNINEEFAGSSHLPKFGDWNTGEAGEANYTVMFTAASKERQTGSAGDLGSHSNSKGSGDLYSTSNSLPKKQSSSWWCFS